MHLYLPHVPPPPPPTKHLAYLIVLTLVACSKNEEDALLEETHAPQLPYDPRSFLPSVDYEVTSFPEKEAAHIEVARALNDAILADSIFRKELVRSLTHKGSGELKTLPLLAFFNAQFTSGTGGEILNTHWERSKARSRGGIEALVADAAPDATIQFSPIVEAYITTGAQASDLHEHLSELPIGVFPEVSATSPEGMLLGYGDVTELSPNGMYGLPQSRGVHVDHLPIHVKTNRRYILFDRNSGRTLDGDVSLAERWAADAIQRMNAGATEPLPQAQAAAIYGCAEEVLEEFEVDAETVVAGKDLVYVDVVAAQQSFITSSCGGLTDEICNNGVDDDGDGLIDSADPDCSAPTEEICDNGIDDDDDGLIDGNDPDCSGSLGSCPESAVYYRDCSPDLNRLTGVRFKSNNSYFDVLNPLLPTIEDQVNYRFDFTYIPNIQGCENPCSFGTFPITSGGVAVAIHRGGNACVSTADDSADWETLHLQQPFFATYMDPDLRSGRIAHFLIAGYEMWPNGTLKDDLQPGSIPLGLLGYDRGFRFSYDPVWAYLNNTNWVPIDVPYYPIQGGEWNPSEYGNTMHMLVNETDILGATEVTGSTNTQSTTKTFNVGLSAQIGFTTGGEEGPGTNGQLTGTLSYGISRTESKQTTHQLTLTADQISTLGSYNFKYEASPTLTNYPDYGNCECTYIVSPDGPNGTEQFPWTVYRACGTLYRQSFLGSDENTSYGWASEDDFYNLDRQPFERNSEGGYTLVDVGSVVFIDLIKVE